MHHLVLTFALIGAVGVGAQWLAWRLRLPAIVLMLLGGVLVGPILGWLDPVHDFGHLLSPMVSLAVALILFEGGLSLNFKELQDAGEGVKRMVFYAGPLVWILATCAAHYMAGLSWQVSAVFGGILVITGPTVVTPMLRQAKLTNRPRSILHWEAIVNDPLGALYAVLAFEVAAALSTGQPLSFALSELLVGITAATAIGSAMGFGAARAFQRSWIPEYMKAPALLVLVLLAYAFADMILEESGLLSVTVMGVVLGNAQLASLTELRRFKEHVTVLLVSGVFVILAATLNTDMLAQINARTLAFVAAVVFIVRPLVTLIAMLGSNVSFNEKLLIGWIGPRGVVAVAVSGFFGTRLTELGYADGVALAPLAFAIVAATVVLHGFSIRQVAALLGLRSKEKPGVLIVGCSHWTVALAKALQEQHVPVLIVDQNWRKLSLARQAQIPHYYGEILSETAEHHIEINQYEYMISATGNDAYNALVCTDFAPEFGRNNVFQLGRQETNDPRAMPVTIGGLTLFRSGIGFEELNRLTIEEGWGFNASTLTDAFDFDAYLETRAERSEMLLDMRPDGRLAFSTIAHRPKAVAGDTILSFAPPRQEMERPASGRGVE